MWGEELPHKKKSRRRPPAKSKHKHDFQPCVFEYEGLRFDKGRGFVPKPEATIGGYCTICGKISHALGAEFRRWVPLWPGSPGGSSEYTEEAKLELDASTRTLPTFHLRDYLGQKYVDL